jgi:pseudaminic acid biosynthesis-associated methylase
MNTPRPDTEQLEFWRGQFGDDYIDRNAATMSTMRSRIAMWATILGATAGDPPRQILEVGSNIGNNLRALRSLTDAELFAVEPNDRARSMLIDDGIVPESNVMDAMAGDIPLADGAVDLAFTSGVLIHIHPDDLLHACSEIHRVSRRLIGCVEYFAANPETITYRGNDNKLFKRDFGSFWLDNFPDLRAVDCGFFWNRLTGLDNLTWWLFEKAG